MAEVVLTNLQKQFRTAGNGRDGGFTLGPVDLTLPDGKLTVLAGPSGCGKTTLLRLIAGLEKPCSGSVSIGGPVVDAVPPYQRDVAMMFQDHALYPHMTVQANLAFPLKMRKVARAEIDPRVREAAEWLDIGELLDRRPEQLSGGQQQRVALGRAIIHRPRVSLLDEPLAHLDTHLRAEMRNLLMRLQRRLDLTMLYVTHDQAEAAAMADQIVLLNCGQVEQTGTAAELYETPSSQFVAGFFGSPPMNFFDGQIVSESNGATFVSADGIRVPLSDAAGKCWTEAGQGAVTLGIRPNDILLGDASNCQESATLGQVSMVEQFDGSSLVRIALGGHFLVAKCVGDAVVAPGDAVSVSIPSDPVHLFEGASGNRLPHSSDE